MFISLSGSGLHVNEWYTQTTEIPQAICTFAVFWAPANEVWETGKEVCSDHADYYWYYSDIYFGFTTEVCNTRVSIGGKPCEEVHP